MPITSPVVLISKKVKPSKTQGSKEANLSMYRFCVDYRFLNSQTQDCRYTIPTRNLQELTESFTTQVPNFITSIDLSAGFFILFYFIVVTNFLNYFQFGKQQYNERAYSKAFSHYKKVSLVDILFRVRVMVFNATVRSETCRDESP